MNCASSRTWLTNLTSCWLPRRRTSRTIPSHRGELCSKNCFPKSPKPEAISRFFVRVLKTLTTSQASAPRSISNNRDERPKKSVRYKSRSNETSVRRNCLKVQKQVRGSVWPLPPDLPSAAAPKREQRSDKKASQVTTSVQPRKTAETSEAADHQDSRSGRRAGQVQRSENPLLTRKPHPASAQRFSDRRSDQAFLTRRWALA